MRNDAAQMTCAGIFAGIRHDELPAVERGFVCPGYEERPNSKVTVPTEPHANARPWRERT